MGEVPGRIICNVRRAISGRRTLLVLVISLQALISSTFYEEKGKLYATSAVEKTFVSP